MTDEMTDLGRMLRDEVPPANDSYWENIDNRLASVTPMVQRTVSAYSSEDVSSARVTSPAKIRRTMMTIAAGVLFLVGGAVGLYMLANSRGSGDSLASANHDDLTEQEAPTSAESGNDLVSDALDVEEGEQSISIDSDTEGLIDDHSVDGALNRNVHQFSELDGAQWLELSVDGRSLAAVEVIALDSASGSATLNGRLEANQVAIYRFYALAGDKITFNLFNQERLAHFSVFGGDAQPLMESRVQTLFTAPSSGEYAIVVATDEKAAEYELSMINELADSDQ